MKKAGLIVIAYFPVVLVALQVMANLLYFIDLDFYNTNGFYLNLLVGTNLLFPVFLLIITFKFKFCSVSRWAAIAECFFALWYLIFQKDDVYNIVMQISIGTLAVVVTFFHFIKKFPLCMTSLWARLIKNLIKCGIKEGSCSKGVQEWAKEHRKIVDSKLIKHGTGSSNH